MDKERYDEDPVRYRARKRERIQANAQWAFALKRHPCTDCGSTFHPAAMQWDHIGTDKVSAIAEMVKDGYGRTAIRAEIKKCQLVCANCHAIRTYERRGTQGQDALAA